VESTGEWTSACNYGDCVQIRRSENRLVAIRSSVLPEWVVVVSPEEWDEFVAAVKRGDLDGV